MNIYTVCVSIWQQKIICFFSRLLQNWVLVCTNDMKCKFDCPRNGSRPKPKQTRMTHLNYKVAIYFIDFFLLKLSYFLCFVSDQNPIVNTHFWIVLMMVMCTPVLCCELVWLSSLSSSSLLLFSIFTTRERDRWTKKKETFVWPILCHIYIGNPWVGDKLA